VLTHDNESAPVRCVITRMGLRRRRHLLATYLDYRRLARRAAADPPRGLLRFAFLIENSRTCYSVSLWSARPMFSAAVPEHVDVVRRVFGRLRLDPERGPELWSTTWTLAETSSNLNWGDVDLARLIAGAERLDGERVG
jgi:hypothetical protein